MPGPVFYKERAPALFSRRSSALLPQAALRRIVAARSVFGLCMSGTGMLFLFLRRGASRGETVTGRNCAFTLVPRRSARWAFSLSPALAAGTAFSLRSRPGVPGPSFACVSPACATCRVLFPVCGCAARFLPRRMEPEGRVQKTDYGLRTRSCLCVFPVAPEGTERASLPSSR